MTDRDRPPPDAAVSQRLETALAAARAAATTTLGLFTAADLAVSLKADRSPVTEADRAAEAVFRAMLLDAHPHDAFLGEETGATAGSSGFEWVVDPIDGTKSFIRGVPLYATLVGCRHEGRGVLGVIAIPALDEMVYAAGMAARGRLEAACGLARTWGDGYGYLLVATGRAEVMIDPLLNPWDAAAVETVVREAGGRFTDWEGRERIDSGDGVATNGLVHAEVLQLIAG